MVEIREMLAQKGSKCRSGSKLTGFRGVTIHNTGNTSRGAGALNHASYLQGGGKDIQTSWHYCVDDKLITQSIPENEIAWHAGDGAGDGNYKTVAIEICMNPDSDLTAATDNAAELTADILKRNGITDTKNTIFQHKHWSGKNCPCELISGKPYTWDIFVSKVQGILNGAAAPAPVNPPVSEFKPNAIIQADKTGHTIFYTYLSETQKDADKNSWVPLNERVQVLKDGTVSMNDSRVRYLIRYALQKGGHKDAWINSRYVKKDDTGTTTTAPVPVVLYYPACSSSTAGIVDGLKGVNVDSSMASRKQIAAKNGISSYTGTAAQNTQMLTLLKQGKLIKG